MYITIIGAGFVGVTTAVALAERGHEVRLIERDASRYNMLKDGRVPFHEPGVQEALADCMQRGGIRVERAWPEGWYSEIVFLCVGTPPSDGGAPDLSQLTGAAETVATILSPVHPITLVVKSTVPPGTMRTRVLPILAKHGVQGADFGLASNPEFLREGTALADARKPDRVVFGVEDPLAEKTMRMLYANETCPILGTSIETAETIKYAANAMLAIRIAFANEVANVCDQVGANVDDVMHGIGLDRRIGPLFLKAGPGFGGSCFPKDLAGFSHLARSHGQSLGTVDAALANNERQPLRVVAIAKEAVGSLDGKRIALLGVAFKPDTSDVRETRALPIYRALLEQGARVVCYDPHAADEFQKLCGEPVSFASSARDALAGAEICLLHTDWAEFHDLTADDFLQRMATPVVVDTRRFWDGAALLAAGVQYHGLGFGAAKK